MLPGGLVASHAEQAQERGRRNDRLALSYALTLLEEERGRLEDLLATARAENRGELGALLEEARCGFALADVLSACATMRGMLARYRQGRD